MGLCMLLVIDVASGICQESDLQIKGLVLDEITQNPIPGVTIQDSLSSKGAITNANGEFTFRFEKFPLRLSINHLGYFTDSVRIENLQQYRKYIDGNVFVMSLRQDLFQLDEVVVSATTIKLFGDDPYSLMDYALKDNRFYAYGYRNYNPLKKEIFIGNPSGKILSSFPLPLTQEIFQDCHGEVYAVTKDSAYLLGHTKDIISLNPVCDAVFFEAKVKPILAMDKKFGNYVEISKNGLHHDYYVHNFLLEDHVRFYRVGDISKEQQVKNMQEQIKRQFVGKIRNSFISEGAMRITNARIAMMQNEINTEYRSVNSTLINLGDTSLLFDFVMEEIICFRLSGEFLWKSQIMVDLAKEFTGRIHHDDVTNRYFLEFLHIQLSYLIEIDPKSGKEMDRIPIPKYKHIEQISIDNNRVFFLHQPDFGDRGKKLYYFHI